MEYRVVIPSRKRTSQIQQSIKLFPKATIVVRREEIEDYKKVCPNNEVVPLPVGFNGGIAKIRSWIMNNFKEECIVMVDDDVINMTCMVGSRQRYYTDPESIQQVLENSMQICKDMGISLFYYNRDPNTLMFQPYDFIDFCGGFAAGIFGIVGRNIHFDTNLFTREDVDVTLQSLLYDRIVFSDKRFYFRFETAWAGEGGSQGLRTSDSEQNDIKYIKSKWGKWIDLQTSHPLVKTGRYKKPTINGARINVTRKSSLV